MAVRFGRRRQATRALTRDPAEGAPRRLAAVNVQAYDERRVRLAKATFAMLLVFALGAGGYWYLGDGQYTLRQALYMTVVTLSTVGYGEIIPVQGHADREVFTMGLLFVGMGTIFYFVSALAAFIIEGDLADIVRRRRMERRLESLRDHFIVCGCGRSGRVVAQELLEMGKKVVVIDLSAPELESLVQRGGSRYYPLPADATNDDALIVAGIERALGIVAALADDRDNLYVTFTARQLNPTIRIVSKALASAHKLKRAGADAVVSINELGGHRMANELVRPRVTNFINSIILDQGGIRIDELVVHPGSEVVGQTLGQANLRARANVLIAAARRPGEAEFLYNPGPNLAFEPQMVLIVLGPVDAITSLHALVSAGPELDTLISESNL